MAETPERVLAIDIAPEIVRGIVMTYGSPAVAGGYAQLGFDAGQGPASTAARIAGALDVKTTLPVVLTCDSSLGEQTAQDVLAAIEAGGFASVTIENRQSAMLRSNPDGGVPTALVGAHIATGLLTSHSGLTLSDLAAVVGGGLGLLGLGSAVAPDADETVEVWTAEPDVPTVPSASSAPDAPAVPNTPTVPTASTVSDAPAVPADDPFRSTPKVAAGAAAAIAAALGAENANGQVEGDADDTTNAPASGDEDATVPPQAASASVAADPVIPPAAAPVGQATAAAAVAPAVTPAALPPGALPMRPPAEATPDPNDRRSKRPLLLLLLGALILAAIIAFVLTQFGGGDDGVATETDTVEPTTQPAEPTAVQAAAADPVEEPTADASEAPAPAATEAPVETAEPAATAEPDATSEAEPTPEPTVDPLAGLPPLSDLPDRGAVFRPPTLFLEGPVQNQEEADELYARAIAVVGPDNVVNNYVVRPDAPPALDGNVRVEQAVLFATGSANISDEFIPTLELGVAVMALNPQVQMVVEGHTDSVGADESNLELSELRAQAVVGYLVSRGVDVNRLEAVGLGETTPVASNETAEGRQINRRIEVNLLDLLAG